MNFFISQTHTSSSPGEAPRWAWAPLAVMIVVISGLAWVNPNAVFDPPWLLFGCNFLFATAASAVVFQLISRSFLARGTPSLLLLACGVVFWGLAGVLAVGFSGGKDNAMLTIHNVCAWMSAGCHLLSVVLANPRRRLEPEGWWLLGGTMLAIGLALGVVAAAVSGYMPLFFVQGEGGTPVRYVVLASSAAMFALSGLILRSRHRGALSIFAEWYSLGLWLLAIGMTGLMVQTVHGGALGWVSRSCGWLGGIYLLFAALAAARETGGREISMVHQPADARLRFALAGAFVIAAVVLRLLFLEVLSPRAAAITFFPAITLAALYGGRGPGLFAGGLSAVALTFMWSERIGHFSVGTLGDWLGLLVLLGTAAVISFLAEAMQSAHARTVAIESDMRLAEERERAAEVKQAAEHRLLGVLEGMSDGFQIVDATGRLTYLNKAASEILRAHGRDPERMVGEILWDAFPEMRATPVYAASQRVAQERTPIEIENYYEPWQRWYAIRISPAEDGGQSLLFQDITARKTTEETQRQASEQLAAAARAKDDFLAALSHELRTPLTPVLMTAAALREDPSLSMAVREQLGMIERNIALEARLIDDLLDLTRIARGKFDVRRQACDAHALIGLAIEIVREDSMAKKISITRDFAAQHSGLVADPARFQQVIWNLLRNAVKFTPRGGSIMVRTRNAPRPKGADRLQIEVADSGIGILPAQLESIFLPFEQGGLTGDHRFGGVGLGLSIARAIVDLHGGSLTALSEGKDRGAIFVAEFPDATLPPAGDQDATAPLLPSPVNAGRLVPASRTPLRLLLVEDHEPTLQVLTRLLGRAGHMVTPAGNVTDALAVAAVRSFDLVVSDLGLPDGTGTELMQALRAKYGLSGIALSGYGMDEDIARSREAGFVAHLTKPVDFHQLERALKDIG